MRWLVAVNGNTSTVTLAALAADVDSFVRGGAVANRRVPVEILKKLASDSNAQVRDAVEVVRLCLLDDLVSTLPVSQCFYASVLLLTFVGWPEEFRETLHNLNVQSFHLSC